MRLKDFDSDQFLREYWQKQPLLIRNPWAEWHNPMTGDELAGLACEADCESRLILQQGGRWQVEHGPFAPDRFAEITDAPWSLLVQAVDHHVPEVAALMAPFRFVPNWRIDDVMVSYATDRGGVGPHFDQYDVFLIQGCGRRRWQLGTRCDGASALMPHDDLRLLAGFEATQEWVLEPGDILYVPPGIAHDGVALGDDCMTYSIGFRAPSRSELIADWCDDVVEDMIAAGGAEDDRYGDPGRTTQANPGEISAEDLAALHAMITQRLNDSQAFARWFGGYTTTRKYPQVDWQPDEQMQAADIRAAIAQGNMLCRNPASRFSFIEQAGGGVLLFVDGECQECAGKMAGLVRQLCAQDQLDLSGAPELGSAAADLLASLCNQGSIAFMDESDWGEED